MKFACTQENLIQGLTVVSHVTGKSINLPVLGNVLLKADGGNLKLSATNLEMAVSTTVRGKTDSEGEYTVPAKLFLDFVALLPQGKVELELNDEGLKVMAESQETVIRGLPANEFPLIPKLAKAKGVTFNVEDLKRAIGQTVFAVSTSESRPELSGVAVFIGGKSGKEKAALVATDSYRLAERIVALSGGGGEETKLIIPSRAMLEIGRILSSYKDELGVPESVEWATTENQLVVTFGQTELISRLIEGSFPDYHQIIPDHFKTTAVVDRAEFQKAVRAAALFSRQGLYDVHLEFKPADGTVTVRSADQGTGKTSKAVSGDMTGETNSVTVNFKYLGDGLAALVAPKVKLSLNDAMSPMLVLPEGDKVEAYRYLVMPIRQ
ncbi:MAG TPA: DNA polymerase III subunit beta [Candidatus Methylomirabilis sp.]|nr:DNA polymerase III subunit beta [Candidatus Methylomirabilis sp.]